MRDLIAALAALLLLFVAAALGTALGAYRRRRHRARQAARAEGRRIIAELPTGADLTLFSEDAAAFRYGDRRIDKTAITAVHVLINGSPIAAHTSSRRSDAPATTPTAFADRTEGIAHDRWDVTIETPGGTTLIECGAIRERVSQELARTIFDAVKRAVERRDGCDA